MYGRSFHYLLFGLLIPAAFGQTRVEISPLNFQNEEVSWSHVNRIDQLDARENRIYLLTDRPYLIEIDRKGNLLGKIGPKDNGPTVDRTLGAFAVWENRVAALNLQFKVFLYSDRALDTYFPSELHSGASAEFSRRARPFGFSGDRLVLPLPPGSDALGVVLDKGGKRIATVGTPVKFPTEVLARTFLVNATYWAWDGEYWYSLHQYKPLIRKYDSEFRLVTELFPNGEEIAECEERLYLTDRTSTKAFNELPPHFTDFKTFGGRLYFLCLGALYEIDGKTGNSLNTYHFFGKGDHFSNVPKGQRLTLIHFAFLEDGTLVLSHPAMLWDHDLWLARLPSQSIPGGMLPGPSR